MPNHTINSVHLKGIKKADLFSINSYGEKYFDFEKLIPSPKSKEECPPEFIDYGDCHISHEDGRDWFNWYDWNIRFWGTKWNSYWLVDDNEDAISFATAWTEPEPIWKALSEKFPNEELTIYAQYEDGYETWSTWLNGELTYFREKE